MTGEREGFRKGAGEGEKDRLRENKYGWGRNLRLIEIHLVAFMDFEMYSLQVYVYSDLQISTQIKVIHLMLDRHFFHIRQR